MPLPFSFKELEDKVRSASNLDEAWTALSEAPEDFRVGEATNLPSSAAAHVIAMRFAELNPVGQKFLDAALEWTARVGLFSTSNQESETRYEIQQVREKVGDWLRSLPWDLRGRISPKIVALSVSTLSTDNWKQACWLLSSIGLRNSQVTKALRQGSKDDVTEKGDLFFCTLVDLGVPRAKRSDYLTEAHARYVRRKSRPNIHSIYLLSDESSLEVLQRNPPKGNQTEDDKMAWIFLPQTIGQIADRRGTERAGSLAISVLADLMKRHDAEMRHGIFLGGTVVSKCHSRKAVTFLLDLIAREAGTPSEHNLMLLMRRLEECVDYNQVQALATHEGRKDLDALFGSILTKTNDYKGRSLTFEADVKDHLWTLALALGTTNADKIGFDFIGADQNPYTQLKVLEDLGCLALDPLPSRIKQWASLPAVDRDNNQGTDEIERVEAIRVVTSAGTLEAFDVLLHSQFTLQLGQTLAASADGLAYLAVTLARQPQHRQYVIEGLFGVLDRGPEGPQPGAVTHSIMDLAYVGLLDESHYRRIVAFLDSEPSWFDKPVIKSRLVAALSSAPRELLSEEFIQKLESWAESTDRRLATSCFETLIKQGLFPREGSPLLESLKFERESSQPNFNIYDAGDVSGGIYAMLAYRDPAKYEVGFASYLEGCAFGSFVQAMETFRRLKLKEPSPMEFSASWGQALVRRALQNNNRYSSEAHTFAFLATYAPSQLASTPWSKSFTNWTPETREALATALGTLPFAPEFPDQAVQTLTILQNDGYFGVRRAAFRALSRLAPSLLAAMVDSLANSGNPDNRKLATEALFWIPHKEQIGFRWLRLVHKLREDVAKDVRDSLWDSTQRDRKLQWARSYQNELISTTPDSNQAILHRWKFAEAITHVGDDDTLTELSHFLRSKNLAANFQRFLIRTIQKLEKNWEKCRRKWPEPLAAGNAITKTGSGHVLIRGNELSIDYFTWRRPEILQPDVLSWGGTAKASGVLDQDMMGEKLTFRDAEGESWDIWIHSITFPSTFSFVGGDRIKES